jgi:hypothetical protein
MMIRKLKEDYEKQIEMLINRLKILSGKYKNNLDLDIHSKYKILNKNYNIANQKCIDLQNEVKILK